MQKRLYFGNLPPSTTAASLTAHCTAVGKVEAVTIGEDDRSGKSDGHGFVEMSTEFEAKAVVHELNGSLFEGQRLIVTFAGPVLRRTGFRGGSTISERRNR